MYLPPQLFDGVSIETVADYFVEGRKRLRKAMAKFPQLAPWEALIKLHEEGGKIRGKTARKYIQEDIRTLGLCLRFAEQSDLFDSVAERLRSTIDRRRGRPEKYGSGKKVKDVTEAEAIAAFKQLKSNALAKGYMTDAMVALFVLVAAHSGLRPIEVIGARLEGTVLWLKNAKVKPGLGMMRQMDVKGLPDDVLTAVRLMISLVPDFASRAQYKAWAKDLAEALARACKRAGIRRLSLYSFRHVALATWKKAGMSAPEIAALAGHLSQTSARNYAGGRHGHRRKNVVRPLLNDGPAIVLPTAPTAVDSSPGGTGNRTQKHHDYLLWEELPSPPRLKSDKRGRFEPGALRQYFERLFVDPNPGSTELSFPQLDDGEQKPDPSGNDNST